MPAEIPPLWHLYELLYLLSRLDGKQGARCGQVSVENVPLAVMGGGYGEKLPGNCPQEGVVEGVLVDVEAMGDYALLPGRLPAIIAPPQGSEGGG